MKLISLQLDTRLKDIVDDEYNDIILLGTSALLDLIIKKTSKKNNNRYGSGSGSTPFYQNREVKI